MTQNQLADEFEKEALLEREEAVYPEDDEDLGKDNLEEIMED